MRYLLAYIVIILIVFFLFLGLLISKVSLKLSWKQLFLIKYKVKIIVPLYNLVSKCIVKKKKSLGRLYKIRNKLMDRLN